MSKYERLLKMEEAAAYLQVSTSSFKANYKRKWGIPYHKLGVRIVRFKVSDLNRHINKSIQYNGRGKS